MQGNHVTLVGYVGNDLKSSKSCNGMVRVAIRMATNYLSKNEKGQRKRKTVWHDVVVWNRVAEYAERSFVKGSRILVEGSIEYRTYIDYAGHTRYVTRIKGHSLMNLDR
jgi:single-strand DNA-binding protein